MNDTGDMNHPQFLTETSPDYLKMNFGEPDAENEWNESPEKANKVFMHYSSYRNFCEHNCLYLVGRRGAGKTAIIRKYSYDIEKEVFPDVVCAGIVDQSDYYDIITIMRSIVKSSYIPENELVKLIERKWKWLITTKAMIAFLDYAILNKVDDKCIDYITKYLRNYDINYSDSNSGLTRILLKCLDVKNINNSSNGLYSDIACLTNNIGTLAVDCLYCKAKTSFFNYLKVINKKIVVCIDSLECYPFGDSLMDATYTAIINVVLDFHKKLFNKRLIVKSAFPTEMYRCIAQDNIEKSEPYAVHIVWTYKHLVSMLAKRQAYYFSKKNK